MDNAIRELENFILDNIELERLEILLQEFNAFEVLNIIKAEIRHSYVLAWLLDPIETHGLGNYFLKNFLRQLIIQNRSGLPASIDLFKIEFLDFSSVEIRREWNHIDILIVISDQSTPLTITIENKIKSKEHGDQLSRYKKVIQKNFSNFSNLFVLLSPDGLLPSDEDWLVLEYSTIANLIDSILKEKKDAMPINVLKFLQQYNYTLRRYVVGDSQIEKLCRKIYEKHSKALDLIFQYKPDIYLELSKYLQEKISKSGSFIIDTAGKTVIRFIDKEIDNLVPRQGAGWSKSKRMLLYEIVLYDQQVILRLIIGPGPNNLREKLYNIAKNNKSLFNKADRKMGQKWHTIYQINLIRKKQFEDRTSEELKDILDSKWVEFQKKNDKIKKYLHNEYVT